jgi:DNA-binding helix-hairpin-helix protein with protein kinase domain
MLDMRRAKLVDLLTQEEKLYEKEFFANLETPEQVREKMAKRLQDLRSKREEARKAEVDRKMEARFKQSADELRKVDSQFLAANTKLDQEQQMLEKVKRREEEMKGILNP